MGRVAAGLVGRHGQPGEPPGHPGGHADRTRQVGHLPGGDPGPRGADGRREPADRLAARSTGACGGPARPHRGRGQLGDVRRRARGGVGGDGRPRGAVVVPRAGAVGAGRRSARAWPTSRRRCSSSTRRTASPRGGTTSDPTTCGSATRSRTWDVRWWRPSRPRRPRPSAPRSPTGFACATPTWWCAVSTDRTFCSRCSASSTTPPSGRPSSSARPRSASPGSSTRPRDARPATTRMP